MIDAVTPNISHPSSVWDGLGNLNVTRPHTWKPSATIFAAAICTAGSDTPPNPLNETQISPEDRGSVIEVW